MTSHSSQNSKTATLDQEALQDLMAATTAEFVVELIDVFHQEAPRQMEVLKSQVDLKQYNDFRLTAHSLKSTFGNLGARRARELCQHLEHLIPEQFGELPHFLYLIEQELFSVTAELHRFKERIVSRTGR